ncbi:MAG: hypothetical protein A2145_03850 [candidate division Zixibacteria bacterium RBG_16_40_9]|nr:MAG: hypothetical protein A2145_03850 [candidate division Zixibacteria bacterium RBG_16_40_9]
MDKSLYSTISVVLPTHNRIQILEKTLQAYHKQNYPLNKIEIVIVDDGSTDGTEHFIKTFKTNSPIRIHYLRQENKGVTSARNLGIKNSQNQIILLSDDDVLPAANLIEEHMRWHNLHPGENEAVLGYVTWSPEIEIDDFMRWCENGGPLQQFHLIQNQSQADCRFFYSGNVSLKSDLLKQNLFDENFYFGFDDFELGYRLSQKGLKIFYNKEAIGFHYKKFTYAEMEKRNQMLGPEAWVLHQKWPQTKRIVKVRNIWVLKAAQLATGLFYPIAKLLNWKKIMYHYKYQNRLSQIFALSYKQARTKA